MAVELATAYVSIVPDTSKIAPGVRKALTGVDGQAAAAGKSAGSKMSAALGTALKGGALAAGTAAAAGIGVALTKGFQRLSAIDDAKGKLEGLGHTTQSTQKIMDSALESVKGTAYGLGDAATIAASAVAAGVKPGQQLTKYLSSIGDAASIAGTGLSEMGLIFNQVQTGQAAYTDDLNQLASRGIPIYQWLAEEAKVSAGEVKKLASEGKISSEMFFNAINKNIGGAALSAGKTVRGSFQNMLAAMGRLGAAAEQPFFKRLPGTFTSATAAIDAMTPRVTALATQLDSKIFDEWGPKIQQAIESARQSGAFDELASTVRGLWASLEQIGPSVGVIMTELGKASAALGVGTWQLFLTALQAVGGTLTVIEPVLDQVGTLMQAHPGLVIAAVAAWTAFRTVPNLLGPAGTAMEKLTDRTKSFTSVGKVSAEAAAGMAAAQSAMAKAQVGAQVAAAKATVAEEALAQVRKSSKSTAGQIATAEANLASARLAEAQAATASTSAQSQYAAAQKRAATEATSFGSTVRTAYESGATGAARFHRTAGLTSVAMTGMKSAGSSLLSMFGGPWGIAIGAAGGVLTMVMSSLQKSKQRAAEYQAALDALSKSQLATNSAMMKSRGALTDDVYSALTTQVEKFVEVQDKAIKGSLDLKMQQAKLNGYFAMVDLPDMTQAMERLHMSSEDVSKSVSGTGLEWQTMIGRMRAAGLPEQAISQLTQMRTEFERSRDVARAITPGFGELSKAVEVLGDKSASAASKSQALKSALDALNPARSKGDALAKHAETLDRIAKSTQEAIDKTKGYGQALLDVEDGVSGATENGRALRQSLKDIVDASVEAASNGTFGDEQQQQNLAQMSALAKQYGVDLRDIQGAADKLGYTDIDIIMSLSGADDVTKAIGVISLEWQKVPTQKSIKITEDQANPQVLAELKKKGIEASKPVNGVVTLTAKTDAARKAFLDFTKQFESVNGKTATANIDLNKLPFDAKDKTVRSQLQELKNAHVSPEADLVIDKLLAGKSISQAELKTLNDTIAKPQADMDTGAIKAKIDDLNARLDSLQRTRYMTLATSVTGPLGGTIGGAAALAAQMNQNANGSIRQYAAGGIALAEAYANGGTRLPDRALIQKPDPKGGLVQWAEPETGGEAFIPLASRKRKRSTDILGAVADIFGYALVPKDSISATLGDAISGSVAGLAKRAGVDRVTKFADGGITADKLKQYMRGADGATYIRGGWGQGYDTDCSGEQSVAAEATKGNMSPGTGTRSGTAGFASYLPSQGYTLGMAPAGVPAHEIGWSSEHASGTIFDPAGGDVNFEMGGQNGGGAYGGGAVSSRDGQFPNHAWKRLADAVVAASPGTTDTTPDTTTLTPDTSTTPTSPTVDQPTTFSGRLGGAAGAFVSGQLQSLFGVLGVNDSPGALAALSEAERQRQQKNGDDKSIRDAVQKGADPKKLREAQDKVTDTEKSLSIAQQRLREVEANPKSSESSKLAAKARVEKLERELAQARADLESLKKQIKNTPTTTPQAGDTGVGNLTGVDAVKAIVQRVLNPRGWGSGEQWAATDWIAQHESSWNPKARNGKYSGVFQLGPEAWAAAGIEPTDDPAKQAEAYADYVAGRYKLPTAAKAFWEANNWYDRGGIAPDVGFMVKNTNRPERVLSPDQTRSFEQMVKRDFQSGVGTDQVIQRLDRLIALTERVYEKVGAGETHNHFPDYGSARADAAAVARDRKQRAMMAGA